MLGILKMFMWFLLRGWIDGVSLMIFIPGLLLFVFSTELLAMVGSLLSTLLYNAFSLA
jgi:hypothetical protein